jgi:polyisoprenoid-binding protein YceI
MQKSNLPKPKLIKTILLLAFLLLTPTACSSAGGDRPDPAPLPEAMSFDASSTIYNLNPDATEARFLIGEILRGEPKIVVGSTNQVIGQMAVNLEDLSTAAVGPIQVDARTLLTDNGFRNRAIETRILLSRIFQYITFTPTAVIGLPDAAQIGEPLEFQIAGDLSITDYTKPVVFDVTAMAVSGTRIEGSAATTIQREDFNIFVPSATGVAGVEEDVILELDFTAESAE